MICDKCKKDRLRVRCLGVGGYRGFVCVVCNLDSLNVATHNFEPYSNPSLRKQYDAELKKEQEDLINEL